jgi:hypothetical protein
MKTHWLDHRLTYDGSQLQPHWILRQVGLVGDAAVAFRGPCRVRTGQIADLADLLAGSSIRGADMVHLLVEVFDDGDLTRAVLRQRLITAIAAEALRGLSDRALELRREGDDLYVGDGKLSISVATRSLVSTLVHFAVNVTNEDTPVQTAALDDLGVDAEEFGRRVLDALAREEDTMAAARCQVLPRTGGGDERSEEKPA